MSGVPTTVTHDRGLRPAEAAVLVALAAIWGASFLFIKVALREVGPLTIVAARTGLGAIGVGAWLLARRGVRGTLDLLRGVDVRDALVLATVAAAIPFVCIAW